MTERGPQRIGFLIFPGFPMACLTSMIEPLRAANEIAGQEAFSWQLISEDGAKVTSSAQVAFDADQALDKSNDVDFLFLLSSPMSQFANPRASNAVLHQMGRSQTILGAISGGVFPLVRAGVMAGHRCSVHWCYATAFTAEFPQATATDEVIVLDKRRYTVAGSAAAFDLALRMIEDRLGTDTAHEVACWFQHPLMRGEGVRQKVPLQATADPNLPPLVAKAITYFAENLEEPVAVGDVATHLNVTPRQVERAFKKATGQSPSHYFRALRMKAARQLVLYSKDSFADIARTVGYTSTSPLTHHYKAAFGNSPREDRQQINAFRVQGNIPLPNV